MNTYLIIAEIGGRQVASLPTNNVLADERFLLQGILTQFDTNPESVIISAFRVEDGDWIRYYSVRGDLICVSY